MTWLSKDKFLINKKFAINTFVHTKAYMVHSDPHYKIAMKMIIVLAFNIFSILFQRGIYPMENFERKTAYGLPVFVSNNTDLTDYLHRFIEQLKGRNFVLLRTCYVGPLKDAEGEL